MFHHNHFETILFDLDGTLRHNIPSADAIQFGFAVGLGVPDSWECRRKGARWVHYYWAQSDDLLRDIEKHDLLERSFWDNYATRYFMALGVPEDGAVELGPRLARLMEEGFNPQSMVYPEAFDTLAAIREAGYNLGLVSNRSHPCHEECQELGLLPYFDFAYAAVDVGAWKPDPAIFDRALRETGSPPERTIYIGDNYYADIVGAKNAGITPVLLDPEEIFPDAECVVVRSLGELREMLIPRCITNKEAKLL
ncbi:MAG: HAD family hydrolase [Chloroflexi bacterium]|nr:HAD family hydrolase [Chloroflexota bacterium]